MSAYSKAYDEAMDLIGDAWENIVMTGDPLAPDAIALRDALIDWAADTFDVYPEGFKEDVDVARLNIIGSSGPLVRVPDDVPTIAEAVERAGKGGGTVIVMPGHVEMVPKGGLKL